MPNFAVSRKSLKVKYIIYKFLFFFFVILISRHKFITNCILYSCNTFLGASDFYFAQLSLEIGAGYALAADFYIAIDHFYHYILLQLVRGEEKFGCNIESGQGTVKRHFTRSSQYFAVKWRNSPRLGSHLRRMQLTAGLRFMNFKKWYENVKQN